jgi:hypothetical protein
MGCGGYNGGGPTVREPQADNLYTFPDLQYSKLPERLCVVQAGENPRNTRGADQHEFGYLLRVATNAADQPKKSNVISKSFCIARSLKQNKREDNPRWTAAPDLLYTSEGFKLAREYHLQNMEAPRPWNSQSDDAVSTAYRYEYD